MICTQLLMNAEVFYLVIVMLKLQEMTLSLKLSFMELIIRDFKTQTDFSVHLLRS